MTRGGIFKVPGSLISDPSRQNHSFSTEFKIFAPAALMTSSAGLTTSGPIPSPGINVILCVMDCALSGPDLIRLIPLFRCQHSPRSQGFSMIARLFYDLPQKCIPVVRSWTMQSAGNSPAAIFGDASHGGAAHAPAKDRD